MNKTFKRLATRLLATTCLTAAASGIALASVVVEPGGGFGSSFPGTLLPVGTTEVDGLTTPSNGANDYFELQGLLGGASLSSLSFQIANNGPSISFGIQLLSDVSAVVSALATVNPNSTDNPTGFVPADGNLVVDLVPNNSNESGVPYVLTLTPGSSTPEPGTFAALGLGLAGLGSIALRRRCKS